MGKGRVLEGKHKGRPIITSAAVVAISTGFIKSELLTKEAVDHFELITDEHRKSAASGVARGIVGGVLLGPVGLIGGAISGKNKGTYTVAVQWADGEKSLIEIDDVGYKTLIRLKF